jgi:probable HAF family extracellular repeat protein
VIFFRSLQQGLYVTLLALCLCSPILFLRKIQPSNLSARSQNRENVKQPLDLIVFSAVGRTNTIGANLLQSHYVANLWRRQSKQRSIEVLGINNSGAIVGVAQLPGGGRHATLWSPKGTIKDLGTLGGSSAGSWAINNLGQVVGASATAGDLNGDPLLWTESAGMRDLGSLGSGQQNEAHAINNCTSVFPVSIQGITSVVHFFGLRAQG